MSIEPYSDLTSPPATSPVNPFDAQPSSPPFMAEQPTSQPDKRSCPACGHTLANLDFDYDLTPRTATAGIAKVYLKPLDKLIQMFDPLGKWRWTISTFLSTFQEYRTHSRIRMHWRNFKSWVNQNMNDRDIWRERFDDADTREMIERVYRKELDELCKQSEFARFDIANFDTLNPSKLVDSLGNLSPLIETHAPNLSRLLRCLGTPAAKVHKANVQDVSATHITILVILGMSAHRNSATNISTIFGLYFLGSGVQRRVLECLHHLGLVPSCKVLYKHQKDMKDLAEKQLSLLGQDPGLVISWDNFDFRDPIRHERLGDGSKFQSVTTAVASIGYRFGDTHGLSRLHRRTLEPFDPFDLSERITRFSEMQQTRIYFLHRSFSVVFGEEIGSIYNERESNPPVMPKGSLLDPKRTFTHPLKPIPLNESTNENTFLIIDDIYKRQLGLKEEDPSFASNYRIAVGDLKTLLRIQSVQNIRVTTSLSNSLPYDRLDWMIPNMGLFHLQLNLLRLIHKAHWGLSAKEYYPDSTDFSTLSWMADVLQRSKVEDAALFFPIEELVIHSYHVRVIAMFIPLVCQVTETPRAEITAESIKEYLKRLSPYRYRKILERVYDGIENTSMEPDPQGRIDDEWQNHIRFMRHTEVYLLLKWSISHGDLVLLRQALRLCCVIFQAPSGHAGNYGRELIRFLHWVDSSASDRELQDTILANTLVNPRGASDSFHPLDLHLEHQNGTIQVSLNEHRSSFDKLEHIYRVALNIPVYQLIQTVVENRFGTYNKSKHHFKDAAQDILNAAFELSEDSIIPREDRVRAFAAPDLFDEGYKHLPKNGTKYNRSRDLQWVDEEFADENMNENEQSVEDLPSHEIVNEYVTVLI